MHKFLLCHHGGKAFGHVIVEAMAAKVPVITTNCPYGPADIVEHEKNGIVVEEGDSKAIASAIDELLNDQFKANRLVKSAFKSVSKFSDIKITDKYLSLFREER